MTEDALAKHLQRLKNEITTHTIDTFNRDHIRIFREVGLGDPCVEGKVYCVQGVGGFLSTLFFHDGPSLLVSAVHGLTNEVLLAIVIDRLECFQRGAFKCRENALAITKLEEAMHWLAHRARDRERRGVEGKNEP